MSHVSYDDEFSNKEDRCTFGGCEALTTSSCDAASPDDFTRGTGFNAVAKRQSGEPSGSIFTPALTKDAERKKSRRRKRCPGGATHRTTTFQAGEALRWDDGPRLAYQPTEAMVHSCPICCSTATDQERATFWALVAQREPNSYNLALACWVCDAYWGEYNARYLRKSKSTQAPHEVVRLSNSIKF